MSNPSRDPRGVPTGGRFAAGARTAPGLALALAPDPDADGSIPLRSIADMRRAFTVGTVVTVSGHLYPELNGDRTVVKAQTNRWCLSLPDGHPRAGTVEGSWMDIPSRGDVEFGDDGSATILTEISRMKRGALATFSVKQPQARAEAQAPAYRQIGEKGGHAPSIGYRLAELRVGQPVRLAVDGQEHDLTVQREFTRGDGGGFGSIDHGTITVGYGPGRWNTEVSGARIKAGYVSLSVPDTARRVTADTIMAGDDPRAIAKQAREMAEEGL